MTVPDKYKQSALMIVTGLVISFVRHTMDPRRIGSTWIDFFGSWLLHTVGLLVLIGFAGTAIEVFHKFYLGVQFEDVAKTDKYRALAYYVTMTALVAAICIFMVANSPL